MVILFRFVLRWLLAILLTGAAVPAAQAKIGTVVIDAGHGGQDKGAYWGGVRESHLTLQVAQRLESLLKRRGVTTVMTRRSDVFISKDARVAIANRQRSAVLVSIHFNASRDPRYRGIETYYGGPASRPLAQAIQKRAASRAGTLNRGVKSCAFTVLVRSRCPAVLVECGFLSHPGERARCRTSAYQSAVAQAICDGVMAFR